MLISGGASRGRLEEVAGEALQHATRFVDRHFFGGVEPARHRHVDTFAIPAVNDQREFRARRALADDVVRFRTVDAQRIAIHARPELERQHAHADQVGAVDTLRSLPPQWPYHPGQPHALGGPVTRRALPVVSAGDDDQRLLARHVGLDGFPHARDLAFGLDTRQRPWFHLAVDDHHLVLERRIGEGGALRRQVIAAMGRIRIEVFLRQSHFYEVLAGCAVQHDRVGRRKVVGRDVVAEHRQRSHALQCALTGQRAFPVRRPPDVRALRTPVVERARLRPHSTLILNIGSSDLAELLRSDA